MKNIELINQIEAIVKLRNSKKVLPKRVSFTITKNYHKLLDVYNSYDDERKNLIKKYDLVEKDDSELNDEEIANKNKQKAELDIEIRELLNLDNPEVESQLIKIKLDELPEDVLSLDEIMALDVMIEE